MTRHTAATLTQEHNMVITVPDHATEREALAETRRILREKRKAEKLSELRQKIAKAEAESHALRVLMFYAKNEEMPDAWERIELTAKGCFDVDPDSGLVTVHGANGSAPVKLVWADVQFVYESPAGVFALGVYDRAFSRLFVATIGMHDGEFALVNLPDVVSEWMITVDVRRKAQ